MKSLGGFARQCVPLGTLVLAGLLLSGCASIKAKIKQAAVDELANSFSGNSTVFSGDNSPYLIREATPFGLKLMETLLDASPGNASLLLATSQNFTQYAFAFVKQDADEIEDDNLDKAVELRAESRKLLVRGRDYALRGLDARHANFSKQVRANPQGAVAKATKADVPNLYWAGVAWAAAVSLSKDDPQFLGDLPIIDALMQRALDLDERYDHGAIHGFFISYEMSRLGETPDNAKRARKHFERAVQLSGGMNAGYYVSLAESVAIPLEDKAEFESLLKKALAIDPDRKPEWRLANLVMQRRAKWLLGRTDRLFL
jgi:predicted anti-sigma-YlaC factor YlaD